jgi:hypothetical protein
MQAPAVFLCACFPTPGRPDLGGANVKKPDGGLLSVVPFLLTENHAQLLPTFGFGGILS